MSVGTGPQSLGPQGLDPTVPISGVTNVSSLKEQQPKLNNLPPGPGLSTPVATVEKNSNALAHAKPSRLREFGNALVVAIRIILLSPFTLGGMALYVGANLASALIALGTWLPTAIPAAVGAGLGALGALMNSKDPAQGAVVGAIIGGILPAIGSGIVFSFSSIPRGICVGVAALGAGFMKFGLGPNIDAEALANGIKYSNIDLYLKAKYSKKE